MRTWRSFIPIEGFQIITNILLVETGRADADAIFIGRPETGGIGSQTFVDQQQLVAHPICADLVELVEFAKLVDLVEPVELVESVEPAENDESVEFEELVELAEPFESVESVELVELA